MVKTKESDKNHIFFGEKKIHRLLNLFLHFLQLHACCLDLKTYSNQLKTKIIGVDFFTIFCGLLCNKQPVSNDELLCIF